MAKSKKRLQAWLDNTPVDAPVDHVESILARYFPERHTKKSGSHVTVYHDKLIGREGFGPLGDFTLCVTGGQRVKGIYLRRLALAVSIIHEGTLDD